MGKEITIKLKKLDEKAVIPMYAHDGDVGMDMTAIGVEYDAEHDMYIYHTGLSFESDFNYGQFLFPRSSNRKTDAYLCNSVGIADSAIYRGEIMFCYKNRTSFETLRHQKAMEAFMNTIGWIAKMPIAERNVNSLSTSIIESFENYKAVLADFDKNVNPLDFAPYKVGERIGQMVFMEYPTVRIEEVTELSETSRGSNGFGSTGA